MNEKEIRDIMAGGGGPWGAIVRPWLWLASKSYGDFMAIRRWEYRKGFRKSYPVDAPVICVGNLTTGGTGKTPMVAWVVEQLRRLERRPAIITRGYKARAGKSDEAEMLDVLCDCQIIVNADRVAGARTGIVAGADVVVLDDGFQHRRLRRDLDMVLIDALNPFGYGHTLPRGMMRERTSALADAHAVVMTRSDLVAPEVLELLRTQLAEIAPHASLHLAAHRPVKWIDETGADVPLQDLHGQRALAFCGLGNPEGFFGTVRRLGVDLVSQMSLDDHVEYDAKVVERINELADTHEAAFLLTTQKDAVKLSGLQFARPLRQLVVAMDVTEGRDELLDRIAGVAPRPEGAADDDPDPDAADSGN